MLDVIVIIVYNGVDMCVSLGGSQKKTSGIGPLLPFLFEMSLCCLSLLSLPDILL